MGKGLRACPICPSCGGKKFKVIENKGKDEDTIVECLNCNKQIKI